MLEESIEIPNSVSHTDTSSHLVLIVDDEEANRALIRDLLESQGYRTTEAANGAEALRLAALQPPDLILLDVMMPGLDGFETCRRLKRAPHTAPIPTIMVTALAERKERLLGIKAGANDFLTKPIDTQELALRVRNAIQTKDLYNQLRAEQEKSEELLHNILPPPIAARLKNGEVNIADYHREASVLVADLVGFTALMAHVGPGEVVFLLNEIFSEFDALVERSGLEKFKTAGDAYFVAGGIHSTVSEPAIAIAQLAIRMQTAIIQFNAQYKTSIRLRIGISTGPVVSGVIGRRKFAYDLWGETVNLACQLESTGFPGGIQVDEATYERVRKFYRFSGPRPLQLKRGNSVTIRLLAPMAPQASAPRDPEPAPSPVEEPAACESVS
jgi:CheY-like chemotaxis protein